MRVDWADLVAGAVNRVHFETVQLRASPTAPWLAARGVRRRGPGGAQAFGALQTGFVIEAEEHAHLLTTSLAGLRPVAGWQIMFADGSVGEFTEAAKAVDGAGMFLAAPILAAAP